MNPFEQLPLLYFAVLAIAAGRHARPRGWTYMAGAVVLVIVARFHGSWEVRAWLPHAYLVLGYWIPAAFTRLPPDDRFERWLCRADEKLFGRWAASARGEQHTGELRRASPEPSRSRELEVASWRARHLFELAYLLCYPMVPAAFAVVFVIGDRDDVTRFWMAVLLAGYACYGTLPWTAARPPRIIAADEHARRGIARINTHVLGRLSHNLNTFPSGHVAVSFAAAFIVCSVSLTWGLGFVLAAVAIAVAAVSGRYHYLVDVLVGVAVAVVATVAGLAASAVRGCPSG